MSNLIMIIVTTALVNNVVLSQFLGICAFLGVSKKIDTSLSMGAAVTVVSLFVCIVLFLIKRLRNRVK